MDPDTQDRFIKLAIPNLEVKKYAYELNEGGYEDIIKYGMAFYRKDCLVKIKE